MSSQATAPSDEELEALIAAAIDAEIRPGLRSDGGDCEFIGYDEGVVRLRLRGACTSCGSQSVTLEHVVEKRLKEKFPQIERIVAI